MIADVLILGAGKPRPGSPNQRPDNEIRFRFFVGQYGKCLSSVMCLTMSPRPFRLGAWPRIEP